MDLGRIGIFSIELRVADPEDSRAAARALEALGYPTIWVPGGLTGEDVLGVLGDLLSATSSLKAASAVMNVWTVEPGDAGAQVHALTRGRPGRLVLGLGAGHPERVAQIGRTYSRPLAKVASYLNALDEQPRPVPRGRRLLAALGPRMLELARERTAGAIPYLVTPSHTRWAREILGPDRLLAPNQAVVLEPDPAKARRIVRDVYLPRYLGRENFTRSLLRQGFAERDLAGQGSDSLIDGLVAWGDDEAIRGRIEEHLAAGADHVSIQVVNDEVSTPPVASWEQLAPIVEGL